MWHAHNFNNPDENGGFLERHNLPKLTQEKADNLNRTVSIKDVESIIRTFQIRKHQAQIGDFYQIGEFYPIFK